jgi:hypothetical protein
MTWLFEDPWPAIIVGLVAELVLFVYFRRSGRVVFLAAMGGVLLLVGLFWLIERWVVTPREEVANTLYEMAAALEQNNVEGLMPYIATEATQIRNLARRELRNLKIEQAQVGRLEIELNLAANPPTARTSFLGQLRFKHLREQIPYETYMDRITVDLRKQQGRWQMTDYTRGR